MLYWKHVEYQAETTKNKEDLRLHSSMQSFVVVDNLFSLNFLIG